MEKTKQSQRQVGTRFLLLKARKPLYLSMYFFATAQPLESPLSHLCHTPLLSPLAKHFSTPSKTEPFPDHFSVLHVFVILGQSPNISYLGALRPPSNFPDSLLNPFPSLFSIELPERSFNSLIRSLNYLSFNPAKIFHDIQRNSTSFSRPGAPHELASFTPAPSSAITRCHLTRSQSFQSSSAGLCDNIKNGNVQSFGFAIPSMKIGLPLEIV